MTRADRSFIIANPRNNNARLTQPAECSAASSHYPTDAELTHRFSRGGNKMSTEDRTRVAAKDANRIPRFATSVFVAALVAGGGMLAYAIRGGITTRAAAESS